MATTITFETSDSSPKRANYSDMTTGERRVFKFIQIFSILCMMILCLACFELALIGTVVLFGEGLASFIAMIALLTLWLMNASWIVDKVFEYSAKMTDGLFSAYRTVKGWFTPSAA